MSSSLSQKTIHFIRHGQAKHNEAMLRLGHDAVFDEAYFDPHLTELGIEQATKLHGSVEFADVELIIVSPLQRAIQTAQAIFKDVVAPMISLETIREQTGSHPCDRRSTRPELLKLYPAVDFSGLSYDNDEMYTPEREVTEHIVERAAAFVEWLRTRPEKNIAVVSHDGFLFTLFPLLEAIEGSGALQWKGVRFANCELRTVKF